LTFKCLKAGTSPLRLERSRLVDRDGRDLPNTPTDGTITCGDTPIPPASVKVSPPSSTVPVSHTAPVAVQIENAANLWGVDLKLTYDPTIVQCTQSQTGTFPWPDFVAKNACAAGAAEYIVTQQAPRAPASGSGDAVRLTFKCLKAGTSPLRLERSRLVDRDGRDLPNTPMDGQITCTRPDMDILGYHTVRAGEWLNCIGRTYRVLPQAIASTNNIPWPYRLYVGQVLAIPNVPWTHVPPGPTCQRQFGGMPPPVTVTPVPPSPACRAWYTVVPGDTLLRISRRFNVNVFTLAARNNIFNLNLIYVGQVLCIP